jgi:hypothetical protein
VKQRCQALSFRAPGEAWRDPNEFERFRKTLWSSAGTHSRPVKAGQPAGSESCVAQGRPWLRSVDSGCAGRVIEPRDSVHARADALKRAEGNIASIAMARCWWSRRGLRAGHVHERTPQEPGRYSTSPRQTAVVAGRQIDPRRERRALRPREASGRNRGIPERRKRSDGRRSVETSERVVVPMSAGNRVAGTRRRDGLAVRRICCEER